MFQAISGNFSMTLRDVARMTSSFVRFGFAVSFGLGDTSEFPFSADLDVAEVFL
jgi:hypothetical protein